MKSTNYLSAFLLAAIAATPIVRAQDNAAVAAPVAAAAPAQAVNVAEPAVIDHVVFLARLPSPADLMKGADTQGTPIVRMDQTADRITVVYQYAGGRNVTFAYTLLTSAGTAPAPTGVVQGTTVPTYTVLNASAPVTTVVYTSPDRVYYSPRYVRYYDPAWDFWAPFAVGVGFGWLGGHGGYYGGHHGGWHHH